MIVFCFVCSGDAPDLGVQHRGEVQVRHHLLHPGPHRGLATGRLGQQGKHRLQVLINNNTPTLHCVQYIRYLYQSRHRYVVLDTYR